MAHFQTVVLTEAKLRTSGPRAQIVLQYLEYLNQLTPGTAGKIVATEDESTGAIRRRLRTAAQVAGKDVEIKRDGDTVYFWIKPKRGRPKKMRASV